MGKFGEYIQETFGTGSEEKDGDFFSFDRLEKLSNMEWNFFSKEFREQFSTLKEEVIESTEGGTTPATPSSSEEFTDVRYTTEFTIDAIDEATLRSFVDEASQYVRGTGVSLLNNDQYTSYLHTLEHEYELPQYFLKEVMNQESGGYVYDYDGESIIGSTAGAQGPFQFMPRTAASYAATLACTEDQIYSDPYWAAQAAARMYKDVGFVDGEFHVATALASYNRGIGNVTRKLGGKVTEENFHLLPRETKDYITKITGCLDSYGIHSAETSSADIQHYA